ncbi:MAG: dTDP-glucose 4,6-dehydratase [Desulfovibrionaceae bacterium]
MATILVTGGAGFIGSSYVLQSIENGHTIITLDALTYSGSLSNLVSVVNNPRHIFIHDTINNTPLLRQLCKEHSIDAIVHFAAETHVDRSIYFPHEFIETNIMGTFNLLEISREYCASLPKKEFRFIHISTDEVFGSLSTTEAPFTEEHPYKPSSPYSASKASSDHLVRSYVATYGLPAIITNCSNNYGPRQYPEKLIPLMFSRAIEGKELPIYGTGENIRDWLYVEDHCDAIELIRNTGSIGETYNIGGNNELSNKNLVYMLCAILDNILPKPTKYSEQIRYVEDRAGHDFRYAINAHKIENTLGWKAKKNLSSGLEKTLLWYRDNTEWVHSIEEKSDYIEWMAFMKNKTK